MSVLLICDRCALDKTGRTSGRVLALTEAREIERSHPASLRDHSGRSRRPGGSEQRNVCHASGLDRGRARQAHRIPRRSEGITRYSFSSPRSRVSSCSAHMYFSLVAWSVSSLRSTSCFDASTSSCRRCRCATSSIVILGSIDTDLPNASSSIALRSANSCRRSCWSSVTRSSSCSTSTRAWSFCFSASLRRAPRWSLSMAARSARESAS